MIELEYFKQEDFSQLIDWAGSPAFLMQWAGPSFVFPLDYEQLENYIKDSNKEDSTSLIYKVRHQKTNQVIGHISLSNIDRDNKSARIARVLVGDRTYRGQGIGESMIAEVLKVAFTELKLHRVSLGVFDFNTAAIACYQKAGFVKDGLLRDSRKFNDEYWSLMEMSILEDEWRECRETVS